MSEHGNETSVNARKTEESVKVKLVMKAKSLQEVTTVAERTAVPGSSKEVQNPASVPVEQIKMEPIEEVDHMMEVVAAGGSSQVTVGEMPGSVGKVFNNDELREEIIRRAIYKRMDKKPILCRKTVKSLRLISKNWLVSVTKVTRKGKEILFYLTLNKENSVNGTPLVTQDNGKLLDDFVKCMNADWNKECRPMISVKIMPDFFRHQNYFSWVKFLVECGDSLVKLDISVPKNGGTIPVVFPTFSLPALLELTVRLKEDSLELAQEEMSSRGSINITHLINSLLNASETLNKLVVEQDSKTVRFPKHFEFLTVPSTISTLELNCRLSGAQLEILLGKQLPNLSFLKLIFHESPFADGSVFTVLEHHKKTLKRVHFQGSLVLNEAALMQPTIIRFPKLEKLEELSVQGFNIHLEQEVTSLESSFPSLETLILLQNESNFSRWTESSKLTTVKKLEIQGAMHLTKANMELIHRAFPNLRVLKLNFWDENPCGLTYLFKQMKKLTGLALVVHRKSSDVNLNFWDAILTGTSEEVMAGLRATPSLWSKTKFRNVPSIQKLSELRWLMLATIDEVIPGEEAQPMISDLAFTHALNSMLDLKFLLLSGGFQPSSTMKRKWEKDSVLTAIMSVREYWLVRYDGDLWLNAQLSWKMMLGRIMWLLCKLLRIYGE